MTRRVLLSIILFAIPGTLLFGQEWTSRYASSGTATDEAVAQVTAGEHTYVTGSSFSSTNGWDVITRCIDRTGSTVWEHRHESAADEKSVAVVHAAAGGTYVLARQWSSANRAIMLLLGYDASGTLQLEQELSVGSGLNVMAIGMGLLSNGNLAVAAEAHTLDDASITSLVASIKTDGSTAWTDTYAGTGSAYPRTLSVGSQIGVAGHTTDGNGFDGFMVMYNNDGTRIAAQTYDGPLNADAHFAFSSMDDQGQLHAAGWTAPTENSSNVLLVTYGADGSEGNTYSYTAPFAGRHRATGVAVDAMGDVLLTARIDSGGGNYNMLVAKTTGSTTWETVTGGIGGTAGDRAAPVFEGATAALPTGNDGIFVNWYPAWDDQSMADEITYSVYVSDTPGGQDFNTANEHVRGTTYTALSGFTPGNTYYVVVRASDLATNMENNTRELMVSLELPPLRVTTTDLPTAMAGQPYTTTLAADGGTAPYQWEIAQGELPRGLTLSADGVISSTPIDDGTYPFTVMVRDAAGDSATAALSIESLSPPSLLVTNDTTIAGGEHWFSWIVVRSGATLTVAGDATINATDSVLVDGTVAADCFSLEIRTTDNFTVGNGKVSNECTAVPDSAPGIKIVADGDLTLGYTTGMDPAVISDGEIMLTDSFTENEDLTPVFVEELRGSTGGLSKLTSRPLTPARGGAARVRRPPRAGSGAANSTVRDGDVNVGANMNGGNGQDAAGNKVRGGNGGSVRLGSRNGTLNIAAGTTITAGDGGQGISITANGCPAVADASASQGGRGGSVMIGGNTVIFGANVTLNRGNGGKGGDATATGDPAAGPCLDGCGAEATSGPGGAAGGIGYILVHPGNGIQGNPTEGGGNGGKGGTATATASDGADCNTCPGGNGGNGKDATATGGKGGRGSTGNIWPVVAGSHKAGDGGDALATGGNGGAGADCCTPPEQGGNGGNGGNATATGGDPGDKGQNPGVPGTYTAKGGNAGDGGDGKPNGVKGTIGTATGNGTPGTSTDGDPGEDGDLCLTIHFWYIYFSTLVDGFITPGIPLRLKACTAQDTTTQESTLEVRFLTTAENGGMEVQYEKQIDDVIIYSGGFLIDPSSIQHPGFPGATWWNGGLTIDFRSMFPSSSGDVIIRGFDAQQQLVSETVSTIGPTSPPINTVSLQPPAGKVFHSVMLQTSIAIRFNHWWLGGWFIDP